VRRIRVPGDKSITQRALIFAALATGESRLRGLLTGGDPQSTAAALRALGVGIPTFGGDGAEVRVRGVGLRGLQEPRGALDFGNSGTGARLMLGVLAGQPITSTVTGDASLRSRPMRRVTDPLSKMGANFSELGDPDRLPLEVTGGALLPFDYDAPTASAQVKSALLLAGLAGGAFVLVSEPHRSRDHTERMLSTVGVSVISHEAGGAWRVELRDPPERIAPLDLEVPGDFSSAAFFLALAVLGGVEGGLEMEHVGMNPTRTGLLDVLARMGARVDVEDFDEPNGGEPVGSLRGMRSKLVGTNVGGDEVPAMIDEFPVLAVLAARAEGVTRITEASELRHKESDRIRVLAENLRAVGVRAEELDDGLEIEGGDHPLTGRVSSHDDHRIAMAFGVLAALPGNRIQIDDAAVADVSFPGFWDVLGELTGPRPEGAEAG
jgi:3-phosphoshikimate 1-carboxyvinyltransferase